MDNKNIENTAYERYIDATVALFMEQYANKLAENIHQEPIVKIPYPEKLDERCLGIIKKECAKQRSRAFWNGTKKALSRAAIILVALLSLSSVLFMTVEAIRIPVINFFIEHGNGFWAITSNSDDTLIDPTAANEFDPNDPLADLLPDEYKLVYSGGDEKQGKRVVYQNQSGQIACFATAPDSSHITVDSENATISQRVKIAGHDGVFVSKEGMSQLAWVDKTTSTSYLLNADSMDQETLVSIAEELMRKTN